MEKGLFINKQVIVTVICFGLYWLVVGFVKGMWLPV
jgi:hypothetical protein